MRREEIKSIFADATDEQLKAVMDLNGADVERIAIGEEWAKNLCHCDIEGFAITEDGLLMLIDECGNCAYCPNDRFTVILDINSTDF